MAFESNQEGIAISGMRKPAPKHLDIIVACCIRQSSVSPLWSASSRVIRLTALANCILSVSIDFASFSQTVDSFRIPDGSARNNHLRIDVSLNPGMYDFQRLAHVDALRGPSALLGSTVNFGHSMLRTSDIRQIQSHLPSVRIILHSLPLSNINMGVICRFTQEKMQGGGQPRGHLVM